MFIIHNAPYPGSVSGVNKNIMKGENMIKETFALASCSKVQHYKGNN